MRCFVALELPADVQERLAAASAELKAIGFRGTFPKAGQFHVTLAFLGERTDARVQHAVAALDSLLTPPPRAFPASVKRVDFFPSEGFVKTIVASVESRDLAGLQSRIAQALGVAEEHAFRPHATLARVKAGLSPGQKNALHNFAQRHASGFGTFPATTLALKHSTLAPTGPQYGTVKTWALARV